MSPTLIHLSLLFNGQWMEDAYFIFPVQQADASAMARARGMNKVYCIDHSLVQALTPQYSDNRGPVLENMVYISLRRHTAQVYYYKSKAGNEVDFLATLAGKPALVQVCASMAEAATRKRELRALSEAMAETGLKESWVVTESQESEIELPEGTVHCMPAYEFLADEIPVFWR